MANTSAKLKWGVGLLTLSYLWVLHREVHSIFLTTLHHEPAEVNLPSLCLAAVEILIVLIPLRRAERWAFFAAFLPVLIIGVPRIATDPNCYAFSPHVHGCHQFMIALLLAIVGLALCAQDVFSPRK